MPAKIYITETDRERLKKIINGELYDVEDKSLQHLDGEIDKAIVINPQQIPRDVITMNSRALLNLDNDEFEVSLVYPQDADLDATKMSVFSPIGTAILGYREGDVIKWEVPSGTTEICIKKVLYQPEASGDYYL